MADDEFRPSEYIRVVKNDDEVLIQAREEAGRGKRFGTEGEVALDTQEAEQAAKWILARTIDS